MTDIHTFKAFANKNKMVLEYILADVYSCFTDKMSDFTMFDGGAHKGFHTFKMANLSGCAKVHAVEADPFMAETLSAIIRTKSPAVRNRIVLHNVALQDNPLKETIPWKSSVSHVGRSSIFSEVSEQSTIWGSNPDMIYRDQMTVPASTIDKVLEYEGGRLPFIKTDLEGADLIALMGANKTLRIHRPIVAFENSIHSPKVYGFTIQEIIEYLSSIDYVAINFCGEQMSHSTWFSFYEAWLAPIEKSNQLTGLIKNSFSKFNFGH